MKTHAAAFAASTTCAVLCDKPDSPGSCPMEAVGLELFCSSVSPALALIPVFLQLTSHLFSEVARDTFPLKSICHQALKEPVGVGGQCFLGEIYMISDSPCTNGGFLSPVCLLETNNISCTSPFTFPYGISLLESRLCGACCKLPCVMCLFPGAEQNTELRRQVAGCWCLISLSAVFIA